MIESSMSWLFSLHNVSPRQPNQIRRERKALALTPLFPLLIFVLLAISSTCTATVLDRRKLGTTSIVDRRDPEKIGGDLLRPREDPHVNLLARQASLPRPFDSSLAIGNNFSSPSCPAFFNKFLNDQNFIACVPLSLLLLVCPLYSRRTCCSEPDHSLNEQCRILRNFFRLKQMPLS